MELEVCSLEEVQSEEEKRAGRVKIVMSAYEIHDAGDYTQYNKNGLHWEEKYTRDNMDSAVGAPFVARFIDSDRTMISDHGRMENDMEDGAVVFPDSDTVGHIERVYIDTADIDGKIRRALFVEGVLYDQRYHNLVKFLRETLSNGGHVKGSVEICGKGDNPQVIYEHGIGNRDEDGNLIIPRTPVVYDITAVALLADFVPPADEGSEMIEINTLDQQDKSVEIKQNDIKESETRMSDMEKTVAELNDKIIAQGTTINDLQKQLNDKQAELNSLQQSLDSYKAQEAELNSAKDELSKSQDKEAELNGLLVEANKNIEALNTQVAELNAEIEPLRQMKADTEAQAAQAEVNEYFKAIEEEDGFSEAELNSLKTDFVEKCDLEGLKAKEAELSIKKIKEMKQVSKATAEVNATNNGSELFFSTKPAMAETNGSDSDGSELFQ